MKGRAPVCFVVEASSLLCYLVITDERCWLHLCAFICSVAVCVFLPSGCGVWSGVARASSEHGCGSQSWRWSVKGKVGP